ncbi:PAS domain S-box protein [Geodermatophilus sp. SYSU D00703]
MAAPALLGALPDAVAVADRDGCIAYANPAVRTLLGYGPEDLVGRSLTVLVPERLRMRHRAGSARYAATGVGTLVGATTQLPALHAAGHEVAIDLTLARLQQEAAVGGDALVVAVLRDASTTIPSAGLTGVRVRGADRLGLR